MERLDLINYNILLKTFHKKLTILELEYSIFLIGSIKLRFENYCWTKLLLKKKALLEQAKIPAK